MIHWYEHVGSKPTPLGAFVLGINGRMYVESDGSIISRYPTTNTTVLITPTLKVVGQFYNNVTNRTGIRCCDLRSLIITMPDYLPVTIQRNTEHASL